MTRARSRTGCAYWWSRRHYGRTVEPTRVFAHHPLLLGGYGTLELAVERGKAGLLVDARRELPGASDGRTTGAEAEATACLALYPEL